MMLRGMTQRRGLLCFLSVQQCLSLPTVRAGSSTTTVGFVRPLHTTPPALKCATRAAPRGAATLNRHDAPPDMFCFQCEQTKHGKSCSPTEGSTQGVCGKTPETAALQDLLVHYSMGISQYAHAARAQGGLSDLAVDRFLLESLFSTLTNVNFDPDRFVTFLQEAEEMRARAKALYEKAQKNPTPLTGPAAMDLHALQGNALKLENIGHMVGVNHRKELAANPDVWSVGELLLYGLKGTAAYADHARILGKESDKVYAFIHEAMAALADLPNQTVDSLFGLAMRCGETNLEVMELLDAGSTGRYGHPRPTEVRVTPVKGKCIAVSGHDLRDLEEVLKRTEGKGINVYTYVRVSFCLCLSLSSPPHAPRSTTPTPLPFLPLHSNRRHGELLPAHGYPGLKEKFPHLVGNYGGAWQAQKVEFGRFPGPVVVTTNCIIEPQKAYKERIYTRGVVGWHGVKHIKDWDSDFQQVMDQALAMPGFAEDAPKNTTTTGFGHDAVMSIAGDIGTFLVCVLFTSPPNYSVNVPTDPPTKSVNAINTGDVKQLYLIGGCDGAEANRTYFRDIALGLPRDSVVLTLGCGTYCVLVGSSFWRLCDKPPGREITHTHTTHAHRQIPLQQDSVRDHGGRPASYAGHGAMQRRLLRHQGRCCFG